MTTTDPTALLDAVLASRAGVAPDLDADLLAQIVAAEAGSAGDAELAMRIIDAAVTSAIEGGAGRRRESVNGGGAD